MNFRLKRIIVLVFCLALFTYSNARQFAWDTSFGTGPDKWSNLNKWMYDDGSGPKSAVGFPQVGDDVLILDVPATGMIWDLSFSVKSIEIAGGTGAITVNDGVSIVVAGDFILKSAALNFGTGILRVQHNFVNGDVVGNGGTIVFGGNVVVTNMLSNNGTITAYGGYLTAGSVSGTAVIQKEPAVPAPVSPWVVVGAFALLGLFVYFRSRRQKAVS